jgi:hypothetical protein
MPSTQDIYKREGKAAILRSNAFDCFIHTIVKTA